MTSDEKRAAMIDRRRDALMAQIDVARANPRIPQTIYRKAALLLTRHWSERSWEGREKMLKTAEFLLALPWSIERTEVVTQVSNRIDGKPVYFVDRVIDVGIWVAVGGFCVFFVWAVVNYWGG
jgi:hypothetical protein